MNRVKEAIRAEPAKAPLRTFYFQLLAVLGDWNKALAQLQMCAQLDPKAIPMAQAYREALRCELLRKEVFEGQRTPYILGEPPAWLSYMVDALKAQAQGSHDAALKLRTQALDMAPASAGAINGDAFEWLCDSDSLLGPAFELYTNGCYYWVPFSAVRSVTLDKPSDLRDLVWASGQLAFTNGGSTVALLPTRYAGSESSQDPGIFLARKTLWEERGPDTFVGLGQRLWATDAGEFPLLEARDIALDAG